jgi:hypothetical protein
VRIATINLTMAGSALPTQFQWWNRLSSLFRIGWKPVPPGLFLYPEPKTLNLEPKTWNLPLSLPVGPQVRRNHLRVLLNGPGRAVGLFISPLF